MREDILEIMITSDEIAEKTSELGKLISHDYAGKNPLLVCILKGSSVFMADLLRTIDIECNIDFMCVSSYGSATESSGMVKIIKDLDTNIQDRHVIIVEDILDSGVTLFFLLELLKDRKPKSLDVCTLLSKPTRRIREVPVKYKGMDIEDEFVVGYGLDYNEKYRNLKDVCILKPDIYAK